MDENPDGFAISQRKLEANRLNAQRSTGPRTEEGKSHSRRNALRHGILTSAVLITKGLGAEDAAEFGELLGGLRRDLAPAGALEELLVEKIALCFWRQNRALRCEAGLVRQQFASAALDAWVFAMEEPIEGEEEPSCEDGPEDQEPITDDLCLPRAAELDRILRYETSVQRQLAHAINQLERLQRARKGEHVPAPVSVQISGDQ
jgi:hypothetical protein